MYVLPRRREETHGVFVSVFGKCGATLPPPRFVHLLHRLTTFWPAFLGMKLLQTLACLWYFRTIRELWRLSS